MERSDSRTVLTLLIAAIAVVGAAAAVVVLAAPTSSPSGMNGGMMGGRYPLRSGTNPWVWVLLLVSLAAFALALGFLFLGRMRQPTTVPVPPPPGVAASAPAPRAEDAPARDVVTPAPAPVEPVSEPGDERVSELTLMKVLNEDERQMYLELREHGGAMSQKDLVGLGVFSRAKVSRVLDKLEGKGIVVRERTGMTNRVRIIGKVAR
ncbi:MAG TPA: MarR family transcriptional regulator [Thermoplasmata archaeon]|nr:MarR family transcriptional regulator [Thermoplasmata archaeon]